VRRRWLSITVKYGIGLALLALLVYRYWEPLKTKFSGPVRWEFFFFSALCCGGSAAVTFVRWYLLVRAQDLPFTLRNAFRLGLVGYFFNIFLPGAVGGDLVKAAFIAREQKRRTVAVSTVLMDRAIGLLGLIAIAAIVGSAFLYFYGSNLSEPAKMPAKNLPLEPRTLMRLVIGVADGIAIVALISWLLLGLLPEHRSQIFARRLHHIPKAGRILAEVWRAVFLYRKRPMTIFAALLLTFVTHFLNVMTFYLAILAFERADAPAHIPSLLEHFILVPVGMASQGFIPLPGGIGVTEAIYAAFYEGFGYSGEDGFVAGVGMRIVQCVLGVIGYVVFLFMKREIPKSPPVESDVDGLQLA
jgi:glycosyltransferase 2 family protein